MQRRANVELRTAYNAFIESKRMSDPASGLTEIPALNQTLKPHQHDIVTWALRRGRAAVFAGTGLGKSFMQLEWARCVAEATDMPVLILAPLAVAAQTKREGEKFGIEVKHCREQSEVGDASIVVTNYDRLQKFDLEHFAGVVLDESSILKASDGKTRTAIIEAFKDYRFRLACTATPAPNDYMELGNHAEFLGVMTQEEMLAMFFIHDGGETQKWRLKGHAESEFWKWMCSWAVMLRKPSDLGYPNDGYDLPPLAIEQITVGVDHDRAQDTLFVMQAATLQDRIKERRETVEERCRAAVEIIARKPDTPWLVWCNLNSEAELMTKLIADAVEVRGSDKVEDKERKLLGFTDGQIRVMTTKPSVAGFGMNWQHCADMVFVGLNDSYEQLFQAIRRCWRFGQTKPVNVYLVAAETEGAVVANLHRKEADAERMAEQMVAHMQDITVATIRGTSRTKTEYNPSVEMTIPQFLEAA
ncbi:helicase [Paraburkholderia steynii]|uniref:Helicase n=1 Tax=Paraburkholderia steynii TaxID=1245441 RepID=A0A4R0XPI3_9BURK|nr:helicase [Paraburkholderia steynii]